MEAIVSLLEPAAYSRIEAMWRILELKCGLKGIKNTPFPHFSWHVAQEYPQKSVEQALRSLAAPTRPFTVQTSGLGIFTGQEPVIYLLITKNEKLLRFHKSIWRQIEPLSQQPSEYYSPETWVPHITLAHKDVDKHALLCALEELAFLPFNWEVKIDNLAVVGQSGEDVGHLIDRFEFEQGRGDPIRESTGDEG